MHPGAIPVFLNPAAGRGRASKSVPAIRKLFQMAQIEIELIESEAPGNIETGVHAAVSSGADRIIVAGGDGSIHEAVNGLLQAGTDAGLGVIPIGTGNDFAKACQIHLRWQQAGQLLAERLRNSAEPRSIDAGRMNNRYFANAAGIGFDAKINQIARDIRWRIGDLVYLVAVIKGIRSGITTPTVRMRFDGRTCASKVTLVNISNGPWVGGKFHIAPGARNNDGALDLVIVDPISTARIITLLPRLMRGNHNGAPEVSSQRVGSFELIADSSLPSHLDGEVQPLQSEFRIEILPAALKLL